MMTKMIAVDPSISSRNSFHRQIRQMDSFEITAVKNLDEAKKKLLLDPTPANLIVLFSAEEEGPLAKFIKFVRKSCETTCVIVVTDNVSMEKLRELISLGVDQILTEPVTIEQFNEKIQAAEKFRALVLSENLSGHSGSAFNAQIEKISSDVYKVNMCGRIVENCILPEIAISKKGVSLFLDCDQFIGINSVGIRSWILWFQALRDSGFSRFEFENLRSSVLSQVRMIQGFIPFKGTVNSFYLVYYNDELGIEKEYKISRNKDFTAEKMSLPKFRLEIEDGNKIVYEIDELLFQHLKFYTGKVEVQDLRT